MEGGAVFGFADDEDLRLRGRGFLGCLATCYEAYRASLEEARGLMTCDCAACSSVEDLDLKFVVHYGDYIIQSVAGRQELLGPHVTVVHLLMKNHVIDHIGRSPYALFTEAAARHLEIPLPQAISIDEPYEHYGTIQTYVLTLPFKEGPRS